MKIYAPMTVNILTPGHIKFIQKVIAKSEEQAVIGLLTPKALQGYKRELMPFKDRKFILESLKLWVQVVPQDSLDPTENLKKYQCNALASGDGFEPSEKQAAKSLGVKLINIKSGCKLHSSDIKN